jgi:hypothetical protein
MISIIGLDSGKVEEICAKACEMVGEEGAIRIANYLCPGNYAVSGSIAVILIRCNSSSAVTLTFNSTLNTAREEGMRVSWYGTSVSET